MPKFFFIPSNVQKWNYEDDEVKDSMISKHVETKISRHEQFILCWVKLEWFLSRCCLPLSLWFCALLFERWWKTKKKQTFRTPFTGWFCVLLVLGQEKSLLSPNVATRPSITVCLTLREALWNSVMKVQRGSRKVNPVPNEYNFFFQHFLMTSHTCIYIHIIFSQQGVSWNFQPLQMPQYWNPVVLECFNPMVAGATSRHLFVPRKCQLVMELGKSSATTETWRQTDAVDVIMLMIGRWKATFKKTH